LLKASEVRKREYERQQERIVQKEREKEGDEFADKEVFVTSAYRKKMQEMQEAEEEERRQAHIEGINKLTENYFDHNLCLIHCLYNRLTIKYV